MLNSHINVVQHTDVGSFCRVPESSAPAACSSRDPASVGAVRDTPKRLSSPAGGRGDAKVLIAAAAGYEGEAAVAALAHIMRREGSTPHQALVTASQQHAALHVRAIPSLHLGFAV